MSLRETREKLNELAKVRAHVAYQQLKLKRQNKIKSRKYRRQLRKEKKKEMEQMAKSDKESKEDEELDRVTERATLKHSHKISASTPPDFRSISSLDTYSLELITT